VGAVDAAGRAGTIVVGVVLERELGGVHADHDQPVAGVFPGPGAEVGKLAERLSTGSVRLARMILIQAMRNARLDAAPAAPYLRFAAVGFRRTHRADRGRGGPRQHSDNRGRGQAPAPAGYAYRCHRAGSAVREQSKDIRRPELSLGYQLGTEVLIDRIVRLMNSGNSGD
jgi:hypothetical protein